MPRLVVQSAVEQVADHLREQISSGIWSETMPGGHRLARELAVNHKTVESALRQLENEGLLAPQGAGRRRRIIAPGDPEALRSIRIAILLMGASDRGVDYVIELRHLLEEAGHRPFYAERTLLELGMDVKRIARLVDRTVADAWVVCAGSREVLRWFSQRDAPVFALFGRREGLPIPGTGPDKSPAIAAATRRLIEFGHRRITLLVRRQLRLPEPAPTVRAFLEELSAHDIQVGEFNLPDWEEDKAGYQAILEALFSLTPPSALLTDEAFLFIAAQQSIARRGLRVPEDVSLICTDSDPSFAWCEPSVAHIRWDHIPVVRRIVRWAAEVSRGQQDLRQTLTKAEFIHGGTIGPAAGDRVRDAQP